MAITNFMTKNYLCFKHSAKFINAYFRNNPTVDFDPSTTAYAVCAINIMADASMFGTSLDGACSYASYREQRVLNGEEVFLFDVKPSKVAPKLYIVPRSNINYVQMYHVTG